MDEPRVTIITPTYRQQDYAGFARMLASVRVQTYPHWEHLVASDGEWEAMPREEIRTLGDPRQRYLVTARHHGGWGAGVRQEVLAQARGEFVCFLDDDNLLFPDYLNTLVGALDDAHWAEFAICIILHCGPVPGHLGPAPLYLRGEPRAERIDTLQVLVRTAAMRAVGWQRTESVTSDGYTYEALGRAYRYTRVERCLGVHL